MFNAKIRMLHLVKQLKDIILVETFSLHYHIKRAWSLSNIQESVCIEESQLGQMKREIIQLQFIEQVYDLAACLYITWLPIEYPLFGTVKHLKPNGYYIWNHTKIVM